MNERDHNPEGRKDEQPFAFMRRRRRTRNPALVAVAVLVLLLVLGGVGWYWLRSPTETEVPVATGTPTGTAPGPAAPTGPDVPPLDLPDLSASDQFVRGIASRLSAHPQLAQWLVTDELIHRFVGTVVRLAGGQSPTTHVEFLIPGEPFRVQESAGTALLDPAGYARFDLLTETFLSLDTEGSARLYHQLHPLFEEAYLDLGIPDHTFDEAMSLAVANVLSARVPEGPFEVELVEDVYEFRDPRFEQLTEAEKHLIRMGPTHARRIQEKLGELADRIGLPPV